MRFIRDKLVDRLIVMNKGKLASNLKDLRQRHKTSLSLSSAMIIENESGYIVPSSSSHETYLVQESNANCSCKLICTDCNNTCIYNYPYTCLDASVRWNMCKHIHLVCRHKFSIVQAERSNINNPDSLQGDLLIDEEDETRTREIDVIITEVSKKNEKYLNVLTLSEKKEQLKKIPEILDSVSNEEELKNLENSIKSIQPTLAANLAVKNLSFTTKNVFRVYHFEGTITFQIEEGGSCFDPYPQDVNRKKKEIVSRDGILRKKADVPDLEKGKIVGPRAFRTEMISLQV
ncbi:MULE domain-containing protein [Trichonephila clavata]|uniref:MULE domain-containing protein n=1 Tax=Trichonephila clavata TaxID=2740835 RepID=A0A8X6LDA3_TRICU|nr:MULE domain-containing protein [Trichonephila clavata]